MAHIIEQKTILPDFGKLTFKSEAIGEDDSLYDTEVQLDGEFLGVISGSEILNFIVACRTGYISWSNVTYPSPKIVIKDFEI